MNAKSLLPLLTALLIAPAASAVSIALPSRSLAQTTVAPIDPLEIEGKLNSSSQALSDGSFYNVHTFQGQAGQNIHIEMESEAFDTYLILLAPDGSRLAENDDAVRTNSRIIVTLPMTGTYQLWANSYAAGETGNYSLTLRSASSEEVIAAAQLEEADRLFQQGIQQYRVSLFREALQSWEQALEIYRSPDVQAALPQESRRWEGNTLGNLGTAYNDLGDYQQAIDFYEQRLTIARESGDREGESNALGNLGTAYNNLGDYQQAIDFYEQNLAIAREIGNRQGEGYALGNLGGAYNSLGDYQQAIDFHNQNLDIAREIGDRQGEGVSLNNLGIVYKNLGNYQQAIIFHEQSLVIFREVGDRQGEGVALGSLGNVYENLGNYQQSIVFHEQNLAIAREIGDRRSESAALGNLGGAYLNLGDYQQAINFHEQSLAIVREIGDRQGESIVLGNLGVVYNSLGQPGQALEQYQQALSVAQEIGARSAEGTWLSNMGALLADQDQPELAIVFYKQSVNVRESIRDEIQGLPQDQQQSFTDTIADDYRALADLLLQQNRILEAQRVLDLLRVQELDDYLDGVRSNDNTESGIGLRDPEQEINNRVIAVGYELAQLRSELQPLSPTEISADQLQRLTDLEQTQQAMTADFQGFLNGPDIQALVAQLDASLQEQDIINRADEFINLQDNLRQIDQTAVMIYPLILENRLELILVTPFSAPARYPVPVSAAELNAAIVEFRQALSEPNPDYPPEPIAQQLYDWLIAPMQADLDAIGAETILYAPDGALRYVPLAALHNGDQWLIENYRINHITAASLQDLNIRPSSTPRILAAAFSDGNHSFQIGDQTLAFAGLPFAGVEVENLAATIPGTDSLFNNDFSRQLVEPLMDNYTIIHLATHAALVPTALDESFILFGNGDRLTLQDIRDNWNGRFNNVELVVLSACETGVGGDRLGNGAEILGFGYLMQEAGAEAAIASLWAVSDGGTQTLMDAFYANLNQQMTKAEALRQAQIALITGDLTASGVERGASIDVISTRTGLPIAVAETLSHPYYWAPFILIGNGL